MKLAQQKLEIFCYLRFKTTDNWLSSVGTYLWNTRQNFTNYGKQKKLGMTFSIRYEKQNKNWVQMRECNELFYTNIYAKSSDSGKAVGGSVSSREIEELRSQRQSLPSLVCCYSAVTNLHRGRRLALVIYLHSCFCPYQ